MTLIACPKGSVVTEDGSECFVPCGNGRVVQPLVVDFEMNPETGNPFQAGDVPTRLGPEGMINVFGKRRVGATANDLMIFDSSNPTGNDNDLRTDREGLVLILSQDNNSSNPNDNSKGGFMQFNFPNPLFHINELKLVDINQNERGGTIFAKQTFSRKRRRAAIEPNSISALNSVVLDWYNVKSMRVNLRGSGAVARIVASTCSGGSIKLKS